ncbi:MAG: GNAT family N-acetyltransferase [Pseudomonadota bacterium]
MFDVPNLTIRVESPRIDDVMALIGSAACSAEDSIEDVTGPNAEVLVARVNGAPVGCITLVDNVRFGEVKRLYVDPEARGNGIGAALVAALESAARDIGLRVLTTAATGKGHMTRDHLSSYGFYAADAMRNASDGLFEKRL